MAPFMSLVGCVNRAYYCKHTLFVAARVLGLLEHLNDGESLSPALFQAAIRSTRLAFVFAAAVEEEQEGQAARASSSAPLPTTRVEQKPLTSESECPVCFEPLLSDPQRDLSFCRAGCGNSIHRTCLDTWKSHQATPTCVYCRTRWIDDDVA